MKPEQLEAIRKRSDKASGNWLADYLKLKNAQIVLTDDVPALLAEVERLRGIVSDIDILATRYDADERAIQPYAIVELTREALNGGDA